MEASTRRAETRLTRRHVLQGLGAASIGGWWAGCATNPVTGKSEVMLLSEEEELQLGKQAFAQLAWQQGGPLRTDPSTQGYLAGIVRELHQVSHRPGDSRGGPPADENPEQRACQPDAKPDQQNRPLETNLIAK